VAEAEEHHARHPEDQGAHIMKLKEIACVHDNMSWADFWIVPSGPRCGEPVREFDRHNIGIMFKADAVMSLGVMPNKIMMWFRSVWVFTGPIKSIITEKNDIKFVSTNLLRELVLPDGAALYEAKTGDH
jgi:hypothetical protein